MAGASPSLAGGVLVCPTTAGAVVGVDLGTRSLLWGYSYPRPAYPSESQSADARATIADGRVLLTPPDGDQLVCLDLLTGEEVWSCGRDDLMFVACVYQGMVVSVFPHEVSALRLADRKPAWRPPSLPIPAKAVPSGRGVYCGRFYYLPSTAKQILQIDLEAGRIVAEIPTDGVLGNLVGVRDRLIAHSAENIQQFGPPKPPT
jgi:outer membrane protein assembly factor BamB